MFKINNRNTRARCEICSQLTIKTPEYILINLEKWSLTTKYIHYLLVLSQQTQTFLRRLQDILKRSPRLTTKPDVVTTSCRRRPIYDALKTSDLRRLEDVWFMASWGRLIYNVLKTSNLRRLKVFLFTSSWRHLIYDVLRTSDLRRLEDVQFTVSWRRVIYDVLKTFDLWCLKDVCKTTPL